MSVFSCRVSGDLVFLCLFSVVAFCMPIPVLGFVFVLALSCFGDRSCCVVVFVVVVMLCLLFCCCVLLVRVVLRWCCYVFSCVNVLCSGSRFFLRVCRCCVFS